VSCIADTPSETLLKGYFTKLAGMLKDERPVLVVHVFDPV
jgi:hypothetical protein